MLVTSCPEITIHHQKRILPSLAEHPISCCYVVATRVLITDVKGVKGIFEILPA